MSNRIAFALAALLCAAACTPESAPPSAVAETAAQSEDVSGEVSPTVAVIGDRAITMDELDEYAKEKLFEQETGDASKLYELRRSMVGRLVDETILESAAAERQLSVSDYLRERVLDEDDVTDEEVRAYYDENVEQMGGRSFEDISDRIRDYLRSQRAGELIAKLREDSGARVTLAPPRIEVAATGPAKGPEDAPVTIITFSDFQCPYCKRVVPTLEQLVSTYPEQVRVVFRNLPLDRIHPRARPAAEAAACADAQGRFWDYHDHLFANNRALEDADLEKYAGEVGLDLDAFRKCVADREFQQLVEDDSAVAEQLGLTGTPAFFVNGIPVRGAKPLEDFVELIDAELARAPNASTPSG